MPNYILKRQKAVTKKQQLIGQSETINSQTITVLLEDANGKILIATGTAAYTTQNSQSRYAKGALYIDTDVSTGATGLYQNIGTSSSSSFTAVEGSEGLITGVTAGDGLTGGGTDGTVTLTVNVDGSTIEINADAIRVKDGGINSDKLAETTVKYAEVSVTNAEMLALRATPKTLVAAPGAGKLIELLSAELLFDYTAAYTETDDNMAIRYDNGTGAIISEDIESTGFVDATADTITNAIVKKDVIVAKTGAENKALVLHNIGNGEFGGGNASNAVRVKVAYRVHTTGF